MREKPLIDWDSSSLHQRTCVIRQYLRDMGEIERDVAHTLVKADMRGRRGEIGSCPIARYLRTALNGGEEKWSVAVFGNAVDARTISAPPHYSLHVALPRPVARLIRAFDSGDYSNLEGPSE